MATPETRQPSPRRQAIVEIAARMFAEKGFIGTTIRDIAQEADILSGSLYHHFSSKESIADEIIAAYWSDLLECYDSVLSNGEDPSTQLRSLITQSAEVLSRHEMGARMQLNDWTYLVEIFPYLEEYMVSIEQTWTGVLERGVASGAFKEDLDPTLVYRTIMSSISGTGRWYRPSGSIPIKSISEIMVELFLRGLEPRSS